MRRPWTFATRIAVGLTASLLVALAIAASTALALRSVLSGDEGATLNRVWHLAKVERLRRAFSEKIASQRGHELMGGSGFLAEADLARRQFMDTLEDLRSHAVGEEEVRSLDAVARAEREHEQVNRELEEARAHGANQSTRERLTLRLTEARKLTNKALDELVWLNEHQVSEGARQARMSERHVLWLILAVATLGLLVAMVLAWVLTRALWPLHHEVRTTAERFQLLVEGVKDYALYLLDPQGRVASWNPGAERIQGWQAEEIIGRPGALLYPPEVMTEGLPQRELERTAREGRLESEGLRLRKDGTRFWAESLLTALRDLEGRLEGYAVLTRDITERKRLERAQHLFTEAERLFHAARDPDQVAVELARMLVPELADGCVLALVGATGVLEPRAVAHASVERELILWELIRNPQRGPGAVTLEVFRTGRSELVTEVTPELLGEVAVDEVHLSLLERLGTVSYLVVPLRAGGRVVGVMMLLAQRPERRFTQTDQVFIEELAGRMALSLENARLLREAQAALELIGVAAHDLGNPLNALQLMLGKLRRTPPSEADKLREVLTSAMRYTQRLGRLLHNLLDLSRLSSGKLELEVGEVDLAELAHDAVARHSDQAAEAGSRLVLNVELGVVGRWDRLRLERVLTNLLSNAFKYGKGQPIELRVERTDGMGRLVVRDHGPGIPLEQQRQIFERFKKAPAKGVKKEGFGLGLYIVRQLVEAHGGTVRVESEEGEGATFTVELPLASASREVDASAQHPGMVH
ncbi:ATP-binding protein [Vitiosangium sp. GDMCC 1.1324]|uniref:sensor histidine kinase n=1 Tax=Vitiosangium sp. (strain GDMCC 1.1324) TaxID=2138576 RepID=UPI000D3525DB|nr:ATP-binding protein [Vitiosangium sp. GDMCC 1.1324]PTL77007.1 histidine kinase [Vitiosangium sp. GDMCC 1.1324]